MKKVALIVLGVIGVLIVVGIGAFYFLFIPPSAEKACNKVVELARTEYATQTGAETENMTAEDLIGESIEDCVRSEERKAERWGLIRTKAERTCILEASSMDEAATCGEKAADAL
jgi:hypothetical protein